MSAVNVESDKNPASSYVQSHKSSNINTLSYEQIRAGHWLTDLLIKAFLSILKKTY